MIGRSLLPDKATVFSHPSHTASVKKAKRITSVKKAGYQFSKWMVVFLICFGLVGTGTLHAIAGYNKSYKFYEPKDYNSSHSSKKSGNTYNNINVGGSRATIIHGGSEKSNRPTVRTGSNNSGGSKVRSGKGREYQLQMMSLILNRPNVVHKKPKPKKVVHKKVVKKTIIKKDIDINKTYVNKDYNYNYNYGNPCDYSDCNNTSHYTDYQPCDCYDYEKNPSHIVNNNNLTNDVSNSQYVEGY